MIVRDLEQTEKALNIQWSLSGMKWNECVDPIMKLPIRIKIKIKIRISIDFDTICKNGRNIYEWNQIKSSMQAILEIVLDWTLWNGRPQPPGSLTFRRFGISKYNQYSIFRNTFQCHWTRFIETIYFRIDGC